MPDGWMNRGKCFVDKRRLARAVMMSSILCLRDGASLAAMRAEIDACG